MRTTLTRTGWTATLAVGLAACGGETADRAGDESMRTVGTDETLSDAARAVGWEELFDGSTLAGWRGYEEEAVPSGWVVDDGTLHFAPGGGGGDIMTVQRFDNFELSLEWRLEAGGNSGVMFRVTNAEDETYKTGTEMQILDNGGHPDGRNPLTSAGANYGLYAPATDATRPVGEWNHARLLANGPHVTYWLNDTKIVEFEFWSEDWKARVAASKFVEWPGYGLAGNGHIALQDHGDPVWFRNVRIRRIGE